MRLAQPMESHKQSPALQVHSVVAVLKLIASSHDVLHPLTAVWERAGDLPNGHSTPANGRGHHGGHVVRRGARDVHVERHHQGRQGLHVRPTHRASCTPAAAAAPALILLQPVPPDGPSCLSGLPVQRLWGRSSRPPCSCCWRGPALTLAAAPTLTLTWTQTQRGPLPRRDGRPAPA